jgi:NAD(P)-dependent dehydrogenase (short-subunit alcohol dehydrogenase family)
MTMARILVTGSSDGLGQKAARRMVGAGHRVVLHACSGDRVAEASSIESTRVVAEQQLDATCCQRAC